MTKKNKLALIVFIVSVGLLIFSYVLNNQEKFGMCDNPYKTSDYTGCLDMAGSPYADLLALIAIILVITSPFLIIMHQDVVDVWIKVSSVTIPILLITIASASSRTGFSPFPSAQEILLVLLGGTYVLVTILFVMYGIYKQRKS